MNNQDYEKAKAECWEEAVLHGALEVDKDLLFDHAFKCGYALGKQEKEAEGEEMLTVSRSKVIEIRNKYAAFVGYKLQPHLDLFGSKCLPDNVDTLEHNVDSLEPQAAEPEEDKAEAIAGKAIEPAEEHFDSIIKDSFSKERRLNIAAMAMQALLSNSAFTNKQTTPDSIVDLAIATADMLIKKVTTKK